MEIKSLDIHTATEFVKKYHYSKIMPRLNKHHLGFFEDGVIKGVVMLGYGTQPLGTIRKIFYKHELVTKDYIEIGKMCFLPQMNDNKSFGSQVMSKLVKYIKNNYPEIKFLYTLADGIMGKVGYVYQASSFVYIGSFWTSVYMDNATKEKIHPRSAKQLCIENAKFENKPKVFWLTQKFCDYKNISKIDGLMFRYMLPLTNEAKKIMKDYPEYKSIKNPKSEALKFKKRVGDKQFVFIEQPKFNMNVFNYNYQKPNSINLFEEGDS
jgi:hypothetical protein